MKFDKWLVVGTWWLFLAGSTFFMARFHLRSTSPVAADAGLRADPLPTDGGSTLTFVKQTPPAPDSAPWFVVTPSSQNVLLTTTTEGRSDAGTWRRYFPLRVAGDAGSGPIIVRTRWVSDAQPSKETIYRNGTHRPCIRGCAAMYDEAFTREMYEERTYPDDNPPMSNADNDAWIEGVRACMDACEITGAGALEWPLPKCFEVTGRSSSEPCIDGYGEVGLAIPAPIKVGKGYPGP